MSRPSRLLIPALAATAAIAAAGSALAADPRVVTPQGPLLGQGTPDGAVEIFRGVPYATPPVGVRRWRTAEPAPDWTAPRAADRFGPSCMQFNMPTTTRLPGGGEQPTFFWEPDRTPSEDCLYLNVWAPALPPKSGAAPRPVMVWIHGGGLEIGTTASPMYDGEALARKGVIVVTINYRLGIFGFFAHPELSKEANGVSGDYGIGDQIEALRWVKRNIAAFGGDPNNVTIFGESAGSFSVNLLVATPASKGLFQKAIGESGTYFYPMLDLHKPTLGRPSAEEAGRRFADKAVAGGGVEALRALSAHDLQAKAEALGAVNPAELVIVDGALFDRPVRETYAAGAQQAVPVIVGFNSDEGSGLSDYYVVAAPPATPDAYVKAVRGKFGDLAGDYLNVYPASDPTAAVFDAFRDSEFGWKMQAWAVDMSKVGAPAFLYYFSKTPPVGTLVRGMPNSPARRRVGAHHASEIPYVFNHLDKNTVSPLPATAADQRLADTMSDYWVAFARTGNPNGGGRPVWSPYKPDDRRYMSFGDEVKPAKDLLPGSLELNAKIDSRRIELGIPWDGTQAGFAATLAPR